MNVFDWKPSSGVILRCPLSPERSEGSAPGQRSFAALRMTFSVPAVAYCCHISIQKKP